MAGVEKLLRGCQRYGEVGGCDLTSAAQLGGVIKINNSGRGGSKRPRLGVAQRVAETISQNGPDGGIEHRFAKETGEVFEDEE